MWAQQQQQQSFVVLGNCFYKIFQKILKYLYLQQRLRLEKYRKHSTRWNSFHELYLKFESLFWFAAYRMRIDIICFLRIFLHFRLYLSSTLCARLQQWAHKKRENHFMFNRSKAIHDQSKYEFIGQFRPKCIQIFTIRHIGIDLHILIEIHVLIWVNLIGSDWTLSNAFY